MPWSTKLPDPIHLPSGRNLHTLKDAANYIDKLPKAEQQTEHWQLAIAQLIEAAEGRSFLMFADVGMRRALNYGRPNPDVVPRGKRVKRYRIVR